MFIFVWTRRRLHSRVVPCETAICRLSNPIICYARVSIDGGAWWHKAIARIRRRGGQIVNPSIAMLALGCLLLIGAALIARGFGFHFPKGYIYAAMAFSDAVEGLNTLTRRRRKQPPN
jgi:hypothetical protein